MFLEKIILDKTKSSIEKLADFLYKHRYFFFTLFFIVFLCFAPLKLMATTKGHDAGFHLQRIQALSDELRMGNYFPRIYSTMLGGSGYASPLFYGDLFMTIPAALVAFWEVELTDSLAYFIAIIFAATVLSTYFCTYSITKCRKAAFCGGVMFGLSSYLVTDLLYRCALGEAQAFVFIPIAFTGFYHIVYGNIKKWYLLPVGLAAMVYCHTLSAIITVVILFVFLLMSVKQIKERRSSLVYIGVSIVAFFALSANFMFPMLEQMASNTFLATDGFAATRYGTLAAHATPWWSILYNNTNGLGVIDYFHPNGIGFAGVALAVVYIANRKKYRDSMVDKLLILAGITLFVSSSLFPWGMVQDLVGILQFPWRLYVFPTFFVAMAAARYFSAETEFESDSAEQKTEQSEDEKVSNKSRTKGLPAHLAPLMCMVLALSLSSYVSCASDNFNKFSAYQRNNEKVEYKYLNYIGSAEYLPSLEGDTSDSDKYIVDYKNGLIKSGNIVYSNGDPEIELKRDNGKLTVEFSNMQKENAFLDVPLLLYKGYTATLDDGTELECYYGNYNRIRVYVGNRSEGTVTFEYAGTLIQKISGIITIISVILMAAYIRMSIVSEKKEKQSSEPEKTESADC